MDSGAIHLIGNFPLEARRLMLENKFSLKLLTELAEMLQYQAEKLPLQLGEALGALMSLGAR